MKISELRDLTPDELNQKLTELHKAMFDMRFKRALHQLESPAMLRTLKHQVSQIKTVLREKELTTAGGKN